MTVTSQPNSQLRSKLCSKLCIVMAQLNPLVGDIEGNTSLLLRSAEQAIKDLSADVIVFPELMLTAYPPEDLLLRPSLQVRIDKALKQILAAKLDIHMVVGYPGKSAGKLYNQLAVILGDKILAIYRKQCLPNYQVFDERRYFHPGSESCILEIHSIPVAFTICEDMWQQGPTRQASDAGAKLLLNINASPFHTDKLAERQDLLRRRAIEANMPIIYVNQVGGQDELVFDGASMAINAEGECQVLAEPFVAGLYPVYLSIDADPIVVNVDKLAHKSTHNLNSQNGFDETAQIYQALVLGVRDYVVKNGFKGVVLGLSGGIDSALTLAIAVDALGKDRVEAVMMPFRYTSQMSVEDAQEEAENLAVNYRVISIESTYQSFMDSLAEEFAGTDDDKATSVDVTEQNLQARCRGVLLMAISNKKGLLVLTTGNKSEMAVGYSTLYGDMAGGFDVLKDVSKMLVYSLCRYRNQLAAESGLEIIPQRVIDRPPSAELAPDQVDEDSLPPYAELDKILALYIEQDYSADAIVAEGFDQEIVRRILRLVDMNEYKRRQAPVGVRLTRRGFGRDRRYPITSGWKIGE